MAHKRGQNEGSIYKRRDGRWEAMLPDSTRLFTDLPIQL
jgi:hypothetical protein